MTVSHFFNLCYLSFTTRREFDDWKIHSFQLKNSFNLIHSSFHDLRFCKRKKSRVWLMSDKLTCASKFSRLQTLLGGSFRHKEFICMGYYWEIKIVKLYSYPNQYFCYAKRTSIINSRLVADPKISWFDQ